MSNEEEGDEDQAANIGVGRYPCMPSLVALQQMRNRLHLANLGKKLMKWSALATGRELRKIAQQLNESYADFKTELADAYILLARCRYFYPNLNKIVLEDVQKEATIFIMTSIRPVSAGVRCIALEINETGQPYQHLGIDKGGQIILETKKAWADLLKKMILLLQLRTSFIAVDVAHKNASKKANVLGKLIIPRTQATIHYIIMELEEMYREELFRIKKVVESKKRKKKKTDKLEIVPSVSKPELKSKPKPEPKPSPEPLPCVAMMEVEKDLEEEPVIIIRKPPSSIVKCPGPCPPPTPIEPRMICGDDCISTKNLKVAPYNLKLQSPVPSESIIRSLRTKVYSNPRIEKLKKDLEAVLQSSKGLLGHSVSFNYGNFFKMCDNIKTRMSELFNQASQENNKERLMRLKVETETIRTEAYCLKNKGRGTKKLDDLLRKCDEVDTRINNLNRKQNLSDPRKQLDTLKYYIDETEKLTKQFKRQGLNTPGADDFLSHCRQMQSRFKAYRANRQKETDAHIKLNLLRSQVANIEEITNAVTKQNDIKSESLEKFLGACRDFRAKIESHKNQPQPNDPALKKLINQLDTAIDLAVSAKEDGVIDASIDSFIGSCVNTKQYLLEGQQRLKRRPTNKGEPVLEELKENIVSVMDLVNKLKREGIIDDSLTDLLKSCQDTRKTIAKHENISLKNQDDICYCEQCHCTADFISHSIKSPTPSMLDHNSKVYSDSEMLSLEPLSKQQSVTFATENTNKQNSEGDQKCSISKAGQRDGRSVNNIDSDLGLFEDEVKTIVKVRHHVNDDGTISEIKETVTIRVNSYDPEKTTLEEDSRLKELPYEISVAGPSNNTKSLNAASKNKETNDENASDEKYTDSKQTARNPSDKNNDQNVSFCISLDNTFGFLIPMRRVKSESIVKLEPMATPFIRHCISVNKFDELEQLLCEMSDSFVENTHLQCQTCN